MMTYTKFRFHKYDDLYKSIPWIWWPVQIDSINMMTYTNRFHEYDDLYKSIP